MSNQSTDAATFINEYTKERSQQIQDALLEVQAILTHAGIDNHVVTIAIDVPGMLAKGQPVVLTASSAQINSPTKIVSLTNAAMRAMGNTSESGASVVALESATVSQAYVEAVQVFASNQARQNNKAVKAGNQANLMKKVMGRG